VPPTPERGKKGGVPPGRTSGEKKIKEKNGAQPSKVRGPSTPSPPTLNLKPEP